MNLTGWMITEDPGERNPVLDFDMEDPQDLQRLVDHLNQVEPPWREVSPPPKWHPKKREDLESLVEYMNQGQDVLVWSLSELGERAGLQELEE